MIMMNYGITIPTEPQDRKRKPRTNKIPSTDPNHMQRVYWVFELEDDGTVLYSRPHSLGTADELEGHNFFDESLGFEDISQCRHHFRSFIKSNKAAASFTWRLSAGESMDTRVLMTRAFRTGSVPATGVVMMEIRG